MSIKLIRSASRSVISTKVSWSSAVDQFEKLGYPVLSIRGSFSIVFDDKEHPGRVVKISRLKSNANALLWLEWCAKHARNPFVPRVYGIAVYSCPADVDYMIVSMEKLAGVHPSRKDMFAWCSEHNLPTAAVARSRAELIFTKGHLDGVANPDLQAVLYEILRLAEGNTHHQDLHADNIFVSASRWIFADPVTGGSSY
jgi:hypothetical protein